MGIIQDYWRKRQREQRALDKQLKPRFELERYPNESFSEYKRRIKKNAF